jgi:hypothetical protein
VTRQRTPVMTAESAGISARPSAARPGSPPPPGSGAPLAEGVAPRVTPTPTRGRVIVPLSDSLPRRHAWRVDDINSAPDAETALRWMFEWARAEVAKCEESRPEDAAGFRWQIIHDLAPVVATIYKSHPRPEFLSCPKLPGGGWTPRRPAARAAEARKPGRR